MAIVRRRLMEILYAQQYSTNFGVYYVYCRPNSKVYKKTFVFFQKKSKKLSIKSQFSTLILICFIWYDIAKYAPPWDLSNDIP